MLTLPKHWRSPLHVHAAIASQLQSRFFLRMHALLLFGWTFGGAYLCAKLLMAIGYGVLWQRYAVTCIAGYLCFLIGMRIWLAYVGAVRGAGGDGDVSGLDFPNGGSGSNPHTGLSEMRGGGGTFDGGGASANYDVVADSLNLPLNNASGSGSMFDNVGNLGDVADAGDGCLPVLAIGLCILLLAGLATVLGPEMLIEVAVEAVLAGTLVGAMRIGREPNWMWAVVKKTAWLFVVVLVVIIWFGKFAEKHYPQAHSFKQIMQARQVPVATIRRKP